jgi:hypothetical protein
VLPGVGLDVSQPGDLSGAPALSGAPGASSPSSTSPSVLGGPVRPPGTEASTGAARRAPGAPALSQGSAEDRMSTLERKSREIDRRVMRSICTGC